MSALDGFLVVLFVKVMGRPPTAKELEELRAAGSRAEEWIREARAKRDGAPD